ncbi:MAG: ferredoxin [Bacteroidetes bacterium]|nr:ferredoxin [Bacteroidota bacterium]
MADKSDKHPDNVSGKFYVDSSCIGCNVCLDEAPGSFDYDQYTDNAYVFKQPKSDDELMACKSAMAVCPVDSIGDNG